MHFFESLQYFAGVPVSEMTPQFAVFCMVASFLFGACFGSFLNVCIYRIPAELSLSKPSSRCPKCETPIKWFDNVPIVGWLQLAGKCRSCKVPIPPRYMIVEAITGLSFVGVFYAFGITWLTPIYWLVMFGLLLGTFVDLDERWIPDRVTIGGILLGLILSAAYPVRDPTITAADADRLFDSLERETTTMSCPYCAEEIRVEAAKCKHCNQFLAQTHPTGSRILTKTHDKVLAGVCGGLAEHFNVDPTLVRALTAVGIIVTGFTGLIVFIFAMVMPQPESVVTGP